MQHNFLKWFGERAENLVKIKDWYVREILTIPHSFHRLRLKVIKQCKNLTLRIKSANSSACDYKKKNLLCRKKITKHKVVIIIIAAPTSISAPASSSMTTSFFFLQKTGVRAHLCVLNARGAYIHYFYWAKRN